MAKNSSHHPTPHQYVQTKLGKNKDYTVYRCVKPGCSHFIEVNLLPGREAECPVCFKTFTLNNTHKRVVRPHCKDCKVKKAQHDLVVAAPIIKKTPEQLAAEFRERFGK